MQLILHDLAPYHWAIGGVGIALVTLALLAVTGRRLGISGGFENVCALAVSSAYLRQPSIASQRWRLAFLGGLVIGGVASAVAGGGWEPFWDLGMFDAVFGWGPVGKCVWMFAGGVLIGFGTRLSNGCTSGHGIFGLSNFELPSLIATASFMVAGVVTTNVVYRLSGGI